MANISRKERRIKRACILENATRLFVEKGYQNTTTRSIAQAAQVSESSIFTYFGTKESLLIEMVVPEAPKSRATVEVTTPWQTIAGLIRNHFYNVPRVDKQLLRDFMAVMRRTSRVSENEVRRSAETFDKRLWDAINESVLLFDLQDPEAAFSVITAIYYHCFNSYAADDAMSMEEMMLRIESLLKYSLEPHWLESKEEALLEQRFVYL